MGIFGKLKKKKEAPEPKSSAQVAPAAPKKGRELAALVLNSPHISEKAARLVEKNRYVFKVAKDANKIQIKRAIEELYGVKVLDVNIVNIKGKKRRLGRTLGFKPGYKKAVVKLAEGHKIEILPK